MMAEQIGGDMCGPARPTARPAIREANSEAYGSY
jgi:hypothetical protein